MMVFTSRRKNSTGGKVTLDGDYFEDIYQTFHINGAWTVPKNIGKPINTPNHDAAVSMTADGKIIFIYYDVGGGDIYYSRFEYQEWSEPYPLSKKINTGNYETHASLSSDGMNLYFTSDRPGGFGGLDIYYSRLNNKDDWSEPVNMGPAINTPGDEDAPFIHPDDETLYFSSNGHPGLGGFDIFRSDLKDGEWSDPVNLGYPINTTDDDIYFTISADNQHGYYASTSGDGFGGKDIYVISMPKEEEIKMATAKVTRSQLKIAEIKPMGRKENTEYVNPITILKGRVLNAYTKEPLVAHLIIKEKETGKTVDDQESDEDGSYIFSVPSGINYLLEVNKEEYIFLSHGFDIPFSNQFQEIEQDVELFKVSIGSSIVLEDIFFDTGKATLRPESEKELLRLRDILEEVKNIRIRISGHTDSTGDDVFNKTLSQKRADSVRSYLIDQGIDATRLESVGYGNPDSYVFYFF
jgi:outer membrane protein OmpA-like peptidoglycan-associated protein